MRRVVKQWMALACAGLFATGCVVGERSGSLATPLPMPSAAPAASISSATPTSMPTRNRPPTPKPPALQLDPRAQPVDLNSTALGVTKRFYVYTPPGYAEDTARLPVVYLFRGHEREWINPKEDRSRAGKTVIDVYEELLRQGEVGPLLLVFPGIASDDNRWSGMLVNAQRPDLPIVKGMLGSGKWEEYLLDELIPYVDTHYRTDPTARAVDGFSLGGFMSVKIAAQHPALFRSVGAYDGLYFWDDAKDATTIAITDTVFGMLLFDPIWGRPRNRAFAAANNPLNLVRNGDPAALGKLQWLIEYGPESAEPNNSNYYRGDRLVQLLEEHGITNIGGAIRGGVHTWKQADAHMRRAFPLHWRKLTGEE